MNSLTNKPKMKAIKVNKKEYESDDDYFEEEEEEEEEEIKEKTMQTKNIYTDTYDKSSLILGESVCIDRVKQLINHPDLSEKEKKTLKSYLKNYNKGLKKFMVSYSKKGCCVGRRYADKSASLQNFNRNIRQSLVYDTHYDIDIKNCGLVILSQYCEKNNIKCNALNKFNEKREDNLKIIMNACNISREIAKDLILRITFLGSIKDL